MRVLFVNCQFRLFENIDCGAAARSTLFVKALAQLGSVDVVSFYKEPVASTIENCHVIFSGFVGNDQVEPVSRIGRIFQKVRAHVDIYNPYSFYTLNKQREAIVDSFVQKEHYDVIACRYLDDAISCGLLKYAERLVVEVDDNPSSAAKRQLAVTEYPNPWSKWTTRYRANAIGWMARHNLKKIFCSFYSNKFEPPCASSVYLPNVSGLDTQIEDISESTPLRILIVGWLDYWPNRLGTAHFVEKVLPALRQQLPSIELHIVGRTQDNAFVEWLNSIPGVSALGYVEDIQAEYRNARICVVPIYHGAGTSVKFIEALSMKRTVVSTPMGCRGFDDIFQEGRDFVLASSDGLFVDRILSLVNHIDELNKIAESGYRVVNANFSQETFCKIVTKTIDVKMFDI